MSFPSVAKHVAQGKTGFEALLAAVKEDCPEAIEYLHRKAHQAQDSGKPVMWSEDPNSKIGKQLIRIHAGDVLRGLAVKHFCHGLELSFCNCCNGTIGRQPDNPLLRQIQCQAGPIAFADC